MNLPIPKIQVVLNQDGRLCIHQGELKEGEIPLKVISLDISMNVDSAIIGRADIIIDSVELDNVRSCLITKIGNKNYKLEEIL